MPAVEITVSDLAALVGGQFASEGDGSLRIRGLAALDDAGPEDLTFFGNAKYLPLLKASRAAAALVPVDFTEEIPPLAIRVGNPSLAFAQAMEKFAPALIEFPPGVHPTAVIGEGALVAEGASIQPYVVIESGAQIGANTVIEAHCYVGHDAVIGRNCRITPRVTIGARCRVGDRVILHSGVVLGSDGFGFELSQGRHVKIPQIGIVQIDDDVEIGANTTVDRARFGRTWIQEGTKIDNQVQIAHNVVIGRHSLIIAQTGIAGSAKIGNHVTIAGQVGIVGHVHVGDHAVVAAKSGISKNLAAGEAVWGSPSQPMKEAKEQIVLVRRLPKMLERLKIIEENVAELRKSAPSDL